MYQLLGRVRFSEVGEDEHLTLHHLINYFQDCGTFHLEALGLGADYFISQDLAFYLLSWQIEVNRLPKLADSIKVGTLIYECKGMFGYRNYILYDEFDEVLAVANVCGVFLNAKTGEFVRLSPEEIAKYPIEEKIEMNYLPRKIRVPKYDQVFDEIKIQQFQIDTNGHVNNSQYAAMALDYLPKDFKYETVRIEYKKATKVNDRLIPTLVIEEGTYYISLCDEHLMPYVILAFS